MKHCLSLISAIILLCGCAQKKYTTPHVLINTSYGDVIVELMPGNAPVSVAAFLSYIDSGFYKRSSFYRVVIEEGLTSSSNVGLIQGGIWQSNPTLYSSIPGIIHESTKQTGLSHTSGTISLARTGLGTASTEFFICVGDQTQFDHGNKTGVDSLGFAAFGKVFNGMEIVRKIQQERSHEQSFVQNIVITSIERL